MIFQLFCLLSKPDHYFEDNFIDHPITASYLRRKFAPQTVALHSEELASLLKADHLCLQNANANRSIICVSLCGKVCWMNDAEPVDLRALLDEGFDENENLEVVTSDCAKRNDSDDISFLVTCWVLFDHLWLPKRYFAVIFKAIDNQRFVLCHKLELDNVPSFTRVTAEAAIADNRHCWLIFTASRAARLFVVQPVSLAVEEIESVGDIYPGLDLGDLPGSAIRSNCLQTPSYRWSVLGFDTGYVIATALSMKTNFIKDRSKLKFSGAVSVLFILEHAGREDKISVLVSSTLGPATIWTLSQISDESHFNWEMISVLEDSCGHDAIVCFAANDELVAIGTYRGDILMYERIDLVSGEPSITSRSINHLHVPVISLTFLKSDTLAVLTTKGLHLLENVSDDKPVFAL
ncbi:unnamed protein product [Thelazia callipaeda]|uniref:Uncharacterized protein n=1 Tax=Thelazia callipaeda TaxID=103827 RepID=A0A3P7MPJ3_THECL|nr:unnamed protein product [Thelazia callipaeda]